MNRTAEKNWNGRFFEDFEPGSEINHSGALTASQSIAELYRCLTGSRFSLQCSRPFASSLGFQDRPLDDILVYKIVFGHSVPDVSMRATATLGYGGCLIQKQVFPGDTLRSKSSVIGLEKGPTEDTGVVHVRTEGLNDRDEAVLSYVRWVAVRRRDLDKPISVSTPPPLNDNIQPAALFVPEQIGEGSYDYSASGSPFNWEDYEEGEKIDHVNGCTIEESEAMMAARLYQNTAAPHYNEHAMQGTDFGRRIVFVGHIVGLARALSYNGLANVYRIAAINRARHIQHTFAGDSIYAWTEVLEKFEIPGRTDVGALRLRTIATKNQACSKFPRLAPNGDYESDVLLDWDYVGLVPRRHL